MVPLKRYANPLPPLVVVTPVGKLKANVAVTSKTLDGSPVVP
jgi:hypothetical protein